MDVLGGWSRDLGGMMQELVGSRNKSVAKHAEGGVFGIPEYFPDFKSNNITAKSSICST